MCVCVCVCVCVKQESSSQVFLCVYEIMQVCVFTPDPVYKCVCGRGAFCILIGPSEPPSPPPRVIVVSSLAHLPDTSTDISHIPSSVCVCVCVCVCVGGREG